MTRRMSYRHERTSTASPDRLHALLLDAPGWSAWAPLVHKSRWDSHPEGSQTPGAGWVRAVGAGGVITREQITADEPGRLHSYTVLGSSPLVDYASTVRFTPEGDGTRLVWEGSWTPSPRTGYLFGLFTKRYVAKLAEALIRQAER